MQDRVEDFFHYLSAERGSSKNTIDAYRNDLTGFSRFALERRSSTLLEGARNGSKDGTGTGRISTTIDAKAIDRQLVVDYLADLNRREYAKATVARKVAAVKSFCAFLLDGGDLTTNPTAQIDSPRAPKPVPKPMTTGEMDALLLEPRKHDTPEAVRDAAMLELTYATGMRVTELVSLNLDSLHIKDEAYVRCVGKGAKERTIPVHANAVDALERYLDQARPALLKSRTQNALFVNRRGERLTRQGFWLILKNYAKAAGIKTHVTPHTLRHSFATHLLRGGASVRDVQELLGHANVSTTQVYTQLADSHLREVYENVHPRAR
ncbi:MAG: tyrosine recombinase XerD [Chloroflexi bacterium]|nr:tyrosine recombinase XerD [Chloroflexota bacterium]MDA1147734.1 tyrosine recombinase XerD [Chloroflexota bacterium]